MEIILEILTCEVAEFFRHGCAAHILVLLNKLLKSFLDLIFSALFLISLDEFFLLIKELIETSVNVDSELLVVLRHLLTEISGTGVDNEIFCTIGRFIYLDEVITASESTERSAESFCVLEISVTLKICKIKSLDSAIPHVCAGRDKVRRLIKLLEIDRFLADIYRVHAAADINAYDIRNDLIFDRHCCTDRAALTGVHVRHDPNLAALSHGIVAHSSDLFDGFFFHDFGVADRCIYLSYNLYFIHFINLF